MELSDEKLNELIHKAQYDPIKAHEYYMRVRKLKGRSKGSQKEVSNGNSVGRLKSKQDKSKEEQRREIEARIKTLKVRLAKLKAALLKQAKARSGVKTPTSTKNKAASDRDNKAQPSKRKSLTAQQRVAANKQSKEYYEKHRKSSGNRLTNKNSHNTSVTDSIDSLNKQIVDVRAELKAAVRRARQIAG